MTPDTTNKERGDAVAKTTKVRTTITPGEVLKVDAAELIDLDRQGLVYSSEDGLGRHAWVDDAPEAEATVEAPASTATKKKGA